MDKASRQWQGRLVQLPAGEGEVPARPEAGHQAVGPAGRHPEVPVRSGERGVLVARGQGASRRTSCTAQRAQRCRQEGGGGSQDGEEADSRPQDDRQEGDGEIGSQAQRETGSEEEGRQEGSRETGVQAGAEGRCQRHDVKRDQGDHQEQEGQRHGQEARHPEARRSSHRQLDLDPSVPILPTRVSTLCSHSADMRR